MGQRQRGRTVAGARGEDREERRRRLRSDSNVCGSRAGGDFKKKTPLDSTGTPEVNASLHLTPNPDSAPVT
jgi:hypothetical protein